MQVPGFRQAKFFLFPLLRLLFPATRFCTAQRDRLGSSVFFDSSGNPPLGRSGIASGEGDRAVSSFAETLMVLLDPVLMCMVHYLKVQTVFLELFRLPPVQETIALDTVGFHRCCFSWIASVACAWWRTLC